jgi:hypothetical protein
MAFWRIEIVGAKLELLGTVEAANAAEAIVRAMAEYNIPEARCGRLIATKVSQRE